MQNAVIVDTLRTPLGKRNGRLKDWHPVDLAGVALRELVARTGIDPTQIDDVIMGCVMQVGEQSLNIARNAVLAAGLPETIPGTTVDRQCGSSQQAAHFAAQGVIAGAYDVVVAAGVEVMTRVPMGSAVADGKYGYPFGPMVSARYAPDGGLVPQGISAEMIADKWSITREDMDRFGVQSQSRAARATAEGRFEREILPVKDAEGNMMTTDEGLRETTMESLGGLKPAFDKDGTITAANASQLSDGGSAVVMMSERFVKDRGIKALGQVVSYGMVAGPDNASLLTQPSRAILKALNKVGMKVSDINLFELNEAFATVGIASMADLGISDDIVNVNGGAIALGHPIGMSGNRVALTILHELRRRGGGVGAAALCGGGGQGDAIIVRTV